MDKFGNFATMCLKFVFGVNFTYSSAGNRGLVQKQRRYINQILNKDKVDDLKNVIKNCTTLNLRLDL